MRTTSPAATHRDGFNLPLPHLVRPPREALILPLRLPASEPGLAVPKAGGSGGDEDTTPRVCCASEVGNIAGADDEGPKLPAKEVELDEWYQSRPSRKTFDLASPQAEGLLTCAGVRTPCQVSLVVVQLEAAALGLEAVESEVDAGKVMAGKGRRRQRMQFSLDEERK